MSASLPDDASGRSNPSHAYARSTATTSPLYHYARAKRALENSDHAGAVVALDAAIKFCSHFGEAWLRRGEALEALERYDDAYDSYVQACQLTPGYTAARDRLFVLASLTGRPISISTPWRGPPRTSFGARLKHVGARMLRQDRIRYSRSRDEIFLRESLKVSPGSPDLASELGILLAMQARSVEAEHFLRYALALAPWHGEAAVWLCSVLEERTSSATEIIIVASDALGAGARDARLAPLVLWHALSVADWGNYEQQLDQTIRALEREPLAAMPMMALYFTDDARIHKRCAVASSAVAAAECVQIPPAKRTDRAGALAIGYLSADFRDHACAHLFSELLELHDRSRFRIHGYSTWRDDGSPMRKRLEAACDKFVDLYGVPTHKALEILTQDGVDILVDLTGYTFNAKPQILAARAAPIQVSFLGYPGTLGLPAVDYAVVDRTVAPQEDAFTEALVYLPESYQVNDRRRQIPSIRGTRASHGLSDGTVFCCFNELRKITPRVFGQWMKILAQVSGSVLWLIARTDLARNNLRNAAAASGIDPARLIFAPRLPHDEHLARYHFADIFLDTYPYGAHSTASDALWMGCPVITVLGASFPNRVAASLLRAVGLPEFVVSSWDEYVALAVAIGNDAERRRGLRAMLEAGRDSCSLFDTLRFTKLLEWSFRHMWDDHIAGRMPTSFNVPAEIADGCDAPLGYRI